MGGIVARLPEAARLRFPQAVGDLFQRGGIVCGDEVAHRVVFMEDGRICDEGPPARIFGPEANPRARAFLSGMAW